MQKIEIVGVVGAGTMGMGICEVAAANGCKVLVFDVNQKFAESSHNEMKARLKRRVIKGKISQQEADNISSSISIIDTKNDLEACDLVVEAIVENIEIKRQLFQEIEGIVNANTLLATNTSSLSVTAIASALKDPSRLFGLHFFNPAPVMKLVEVIRGLMTKEEHVNTAKKLCLSWGKKPVVAKSTPGFIVNRVARPYYGESLKMFQEQLAGHEYIDTVLTECTGFKMGPFTLMDLIGIDINYAVSQSVYKEMFNDPRFKPSLLQGEMVFANNLGKKTGQGFYDYSETAKNNQPEYAYSDANFDQLIVPSETTYLSQLFSEFEYDNRKWQGDKIIVDGCQLVLSYGLSAKQIEINEGLPTCVVDLSFNYRKCESINLSFGPMVNEYMQHRIIALLNHIGKKVLITDDQPGLVGLRIIVLLINEAADAVFNGVCSAKDVDLSMRYGVNYPKGLLTFAQELGWHHVADSLINLQNWFGDDRYRLSPYIRNHL